MDIAVGIDVGFSASRRSTGVVVVDRATKAVVQGSRPVVLDAASAMEFLAKELRRLNPSSARFVVDGPFAPGQGNSKCRMAERFLMRGPFASGPPHGRKLRLSPAPTAAGSKFLASTLDVLRGISALGYVRMELTSSCMHGDIVEIFPTVFMAALLPPHPFTGRRDEHTDELWLTAVGRRALNGNLRLVPALAPYQALIDCVEAASSCDRHDLRAAAICAIAGDWLATSSSSSEAATPVATFLGHRDEFGFLLPPKAFMDPGFLVMLEEHWLTNCEPSLLWV